MNIKKIGKANQNIISIGIVKLKSEFLFWQRSSYFDVD